MQLVGAEREQLVSFLVEEFDWVARQQHPKLISLEAPLGWGKTRIVQSFYERLAARQPSPRYWPSWLADPDGTDPLQGRKKIAPPKVTAGAEMRWMWWGLSCQLSREGVPAHALGQYAGQLDLHLASVVRAQADNARLMQQVQELGKSIVGLIPGAGQAMGYVDTGVRLYKLSHAIVRRHSADGGDDPAPHPVTAIDPGRAPMIAKVVDLLRLVANRRLPVVMVVEDAHDADDSLVSLLDQVFAGSVPVAVLCVLTSWPDRLEEQQRQSVGLGSWLARASSQPWRHCQRRRLAPLPTRDLQRLVERHAPRTDLAALAERADGNPFVLQGLLLAARARGATTGDRIELSAEVVATLPNTQEELMRERWLAMPDEVKEAMCLCSLQGREAVQELVRLAQRVVRPKSVTQIDEATAQAADPYGWIRRIGDLLRFAEQYTLEIACRMQAVYFGTHVEIARAGEVPDLAAAAGSACEAAVAALDRGAYRAALALARDGSAWADRGPARRAGHARRAGTGPGAAGGYRRRLPARARGAAREDPRRTGEPGPDPAAGRRPAGQRPPAGGGSPAGGDARRRAPAGAVGAPRRARGRHGPGGLQERAAAAGGAAGRSRAGPRDHPPTHWRGATGARLGAAPVDRRPGRRRPPQASSPSRPTPAPLYERRARTLLELELAERRRALGPLHRATLEAGADLAYARFRLGEGEAAVALLEELVGERERAFGPESAELLTARAACGDVLFALGAYQEAEQLFAEVAAVRENVLGPDHPDTVATRFRVGQALQALGQPDAALAVFGDTLAALRRTLGPNHPQTILALANVAETASGSRWSDPTTSRPCGPATGSRGPWPRAAIGSAHDGCSTT